MKALIIDDDIPTTQVIRESIDWAGLGIGETFIAHNITRAKKIIDEHAPEIIICDIEMPKGSGIDLIQWARGAGCASHFIFLTCHEEFYYASAAIKYAADAYVTKPFDVKTMQGVIAAVVEKIAYQNQLQQYKNFGERWASNRQERESGFWRDLLFGALPREVEAVRMIAEDRGVELDGAAGHRLLLCSVLESQIEDAELDSNAFCRALSHLVNQVVGGSPELVRTLDYTANGSIHVVKVLDGDMDLRGDAHSLIELGEELIIRCRILLQCELTCYLGPVVPLEKLPDARAALEEADGCNMARRGGVLTVPAGSPEPGIPYVFDSRPLEQLIQEERGAEAVNRLRQELEGLAAQDRLNKEAMQRIQHDYLQVIYSFLYANNVQAHELFSDEASQKLFRVSAYSAFDLLKWASYITAKTFQHIKDTRETDSVVSRLKRFIAENYARKLTREDIAAAVFLSPDYVAKIFHHETGLYIKDYLNEVRIGKARQLIKEGKLNVSEIAAIVGFDNFPYFSSLFKKSTGVTPSEYRRQDTTRGDRSERPLR
jgi:two-component system, response regulator YesN